MSIITKKKTTEIFLASLDNLPLNTQRCQRNTIKKFTVFIRETQNITPDQLCEELMIMKNSSIRSSLYCSETIKINAS